MCLSKHNVPVIRDKPQTLLPTLIIGTTFIQGKIQFKEMYVNISRG